MLSRHVNGSHGIDGLWSVLNAQMNCPWSHFLPSTLLSFHRPLMPVSPKICKSLLFSFENRALPPLIISSYLQ